MLTAYEYFLFDHKHCNKIPCVSCPKLSVDTSSLTSHFQTITRSQSVHLVSQEPIYFSPSDHLHFIQVESQDQPYNSFLIGFLPTSPQV